MKLKKIAAFAIVWLLTLSEALAQPARFIPATRPSNLPRAGDFGLLLTRVINYFLGLVGLFAVVMLVIGGIRYVTSGGNEENITKAKNTIFYAILGIVVVVLSFAIVYTLTVTLKSF